MLFKFLGFLVFQIAVDAREDLLLDERVQLVGDDAREGVAHGA